MCGICGVVQIGGPPREVVAPDVLESMLDTIVHRGPSDDGVYQAPGVALGVRRLSIVDVEGGHQPVSNEDASIWAVQNGELYNHLDVRRRLLRTSFSQPLRHRGDPAPVRGARRRFPEELRGMFAIAVWDERRRRLVLARDRLGIKPLYFGRAGDLVVFGSELKAVLASGLFQPDLDYDAIDAYLTLGYFPAPLTPLGSPQAPSRARAHDRRDDPRRSILDVPASVSRVRCRWRTPLSSSSRSSKNPSGSA